MHYKLNFNINIYLQRKLLRELDKYISKFPDLFHWSEKLEIQYQASLSHYLKSFKLT